MAAFRTSRRGRKLSVGNKRPERIPASEKAICAHLDAWLSDPETTPDRMTWPHWAGKNGHAGQVPLTAHGENVMKSPWLTENLKKKEQE